MLICSGQGWWIDTLSCQCLQEEGFSGGQDKRALAQEGLGGGPEPFPPSSVLEQPCGEAVKGRACSRG